MSTQTPEQLYGTILIGAAVTIAAGAWVSLWLVPVGIIVTAVVVGIKNGGIRP